MSAWASIPSPPATPSGAGTSQVKVIHGPSRFLPGTSWIVSCWTLLVSSSCRCLCSSMETLKALGGGGEGGREDKRSRWFSLIWPPISELRWHYGFQVIKGLESIEALNPPIYHSQFRIFRGVDSKFKSLTHGGQRRSILASQDGRGEQHLGEQGAWMCRHQVAGLVLSIQSLDKLGQLLSVELLLRGKVGQTTTNEQWYGENLH